jgi:hypothetical protein
MITSIKLYLTIAGVYQAYNINQMTPTTKKIKAIAPRILGRYFIIPRYEKLENLIRSLCSIPVSMPFRGNTVGITLHR